MGILVGFGGGGEWVVNHFDFGASSVFVGGRRGPEHE